MWTCCSACLRVLRYSQCCCCRCHCYYYGCTCHRTWTAARTSDGSWRPLVCNSSDADAGVDKRSREPLSDAIVGARAAHVAVAAVVAAVVAVEDKEDAK